MKKRKQKNLKQKNKSSRYRKTNLRTVSDVISEILFIVTIQFYGQKNTYVDETAHILIKQGKTLKNQKTRIWVRKKNAKVALLVWSPGFSIKHKNNCHTNSSNSSWMFVRKNPA